MSASPSETKLPTNLQQEINRYKHQKIMHQVFHELLYIKCENCNKYVKKTRAIITEIVNYEFTFCGNKCYNDYSYRFTKIHKAIYGF
jgi:hypothetical protein